MSKDVVGRMLKTGTLDEKRPGVLAFCASPPTWKQRLMVPCLATDGVVASCRSAGRLQALDGLSRFELVEVSATHRFRSPGCIAHEARELARCDVTRVDGIPVTNIARTLCDLDSVCPPDLVERALDSARRRGVSLRWIRETAVRLHRPGQRGTRVLLALLDAINPGERVRDSWFERVVELVLGDPAIPQIVRQHELYDEEGVFVARFDLGLPSIKLGIEAHSREFHFGAAAEGRDEDRDHRVSECGWDTVYLGHMSTRRPDETRVRVAKIVASRAALVLGELRPDGRIGP